MRFYEFNDFGYYGLIGASTVEEALDEYKNTINDVREEGLIPSEITLEEAREKYCKCLVEQGEEDKTYEEFKKDFNKFSTNEEVFVFLIEGNLL